MYLYRPSHASGSKKVARSVCIRDVIIDVTIWALNLRDGKWNMAVLVIMSMRFDVDGGAGSDHDIPERRSERCIDDR